MGIKDTEIRTSVRCKWLDTEDIPTIFSLADRLETNSDCELYLQSRRRLAKAELSGDVSKKAQAHLAALLSSQASGSSTPALTKPKRGKRPRTRPLNLRSNRSNTNSSSRSRNKTTNNQTKILNSTGTNSTMINNGTITNITNTNLNNLVAPTEAAARTAGPREAPIRRALTLRRTWDSGCERRRSLKRKFGPSSRPNRRAARRRIRRSPSSSPRSVDRW